MIICWLSRQTGLEPTGYWDEEFDGITVSMETELGLCHWAVGDKAAAAFLRAFITVHMDHSPRRCRRYLIGCEGKNLGVRSSPTRMVQFRHPATEKDLPPTVPTPQNDNSFQIFNKTHPLHAIHLSRTKYLWVNNVVYSKANINSMQTKPGNKSNDMKSRCL